MLFRKPDNETNAGQSTTPSLHGRPSPLPAMTGTGKAFGGAQIPTISKIDSGLFVVIETS